MVPTDSPIWTVAGTIAVAAITGIVTFMLGRPKTKADVQTTLNAGFQNLITELQEERNALRKIVEEQGVVVQRISGELRQMTQRVDSLERFIARNDLKVPEM